MLKPRFAVLTGLVFTAALSRLIPHPWNFTPITAIALFGGAKFSAKKYAFLVPFAALFLSDLLIGVYGRMPMVYLSWAAVIGIGFWIRTKRGASPVAAGVLAGTMLFFLLTNFGVWAFGTLYPKSFSGLVQCYVVGLPYFRNMLVGDVFYAALLFGSFAAAEKRFPLLRHPTVQPG